MFNLKILRFFEGFSKSNNLTSFLVQERYHKFMGMIFQILWLIFLISIWNIKYFIVVALSILIMIIYLFVIVNLVGAIKDTITIYIDTLILVILNINHRSSCLDYRLSVKKWDNHLLPTVSNYFLLPCILHLLNSYSWFFCFCWLWFGFV